ncbi:MAG: hypothetical protein SNJ67_06545 [Chloracidobacterium sp.]|uniref:Uncharacterized protein n=1 Tax=Chloracidobacterium validum TaxID=2821543 RepID=A0ABX8B9R4_9BACT|nr:hypothetical protein [Chloracidobacterium validum]QUW03409.1 hypothetical protein J8C06_02940 [Chloracidobacterium validum]
METKPTIETVLERMAEQTAILQALAAEVAGLKTEVAGLKTEVAGLKTWVQELDTRARRIENRVNVLGQDVLDVRAYLQRIDMRLDTEVASIKVAG